MAGLFSQATLEQIRAANDIVDIIGAVVPLRRAGANFLALCPFHKEKTPSFNVNPQRQVFYCFGCHKGGNVFTFLREYENLDFPEAVRRLAERAKIPLAYETGAEPQLRSLKEKLLEIHAQITLRWQNALANEASGEVARDYLDRRGVSAEAVQLFRLGYAPDLWDDTVNWARSKDYDLATVEKAGLILRKEGSDHFYDRFRGRLMFPIADEQGRVIGFSGRILSGDEKTAKYVNSPETLIFTKSKVFFGLDKSKRALLEAGSAVICEGQLDLIACFMAGIQNVVAPQGTAFTADHARILKRYVQEVVLCFDSDQAGQNAAVRSLDHLLASELAVRVAVVPPPDDPDSFIKNHGSAAFKEVLERAEGFFDFYLARLCGLNDLGSDRGRLIVLRSMAEAVQKTGNNVLIDGYARKTALRLGVSPDSVRLEFGKRQRASPSAQEPSLVEESPVLPRSQPPTPHQEWLLKLLLLYEELQDWAVAHFEPEWVSHPLAREIVQQRFSAHRNQTWSSLPGFLEQCNGPDMRTLVARVSVQERAIPNPAQQLADVALRLRNQVLDQKLMTLVRRANDPTTDEAEQLRCLREQEVLRSAKRQPLVP